MHLLTSVAAVLALLPVAIGVAKDPYKTSAGALAANYPGGLDFYSNCWRLHGCDWEPAVDNFKKPISGAQQCSCNNNPDGWDDLIWWYTGASFTGDLMKGFGHWGECQDLQTHWKNKAKSVQINELPDLHIICCVYTQPGCNRDTGIWTTRDGTIPSEQSTKQLVGLFEGIQSWQCSEKFTSASDCRDK